MDLVLELLPLVASVFAAFAFAGLILWSTTTIRYHLEPPDLRISWLGLPVRRIPLNDIKTIGQRPVFWAEHWVNALQPRNRRLVLRRGHGLFRALVITPKNHLVFKAELERARKPDTHSSDAEPGQAGATEFSRQSWPGSGPS